MLPNDPTPSLQGGPAATAPRLGRQGRAEVSNSGAPSLQGQHQLPGGGAAQGGGQVDQERHPCVGSQPQHFQSHKGQWI